jgi:hypothetical protein
MEALSSRPDQFTEATEAAVEAPTEQPANKVAEATLLEASQDNTGGSAETESFSSHEPDGEAKPTLVDLRPVREPIPPVACLAPDQSLPSHAGLWRRMRTEERRPDTDSPNLAAEVEPVEPRSMRLSEQRQPRGRFPLLAASLALAAAVGAAGGAAGFIAAREFMAVPAPAAAGHQSSRQLLPGRVFSGTN